QGAGEHPMIPGRDRPADILQLSRLCRRVIDVLTEGPAAEQPHRGPAERGGVPFDEPNGFLPPGARVDGAPEDGGVGPAEPRGLVHRPGLRLMPALGQTLGDPAGDPGGRSVLAGVRDEDHVSSFRSPSNGTGGCPGWTVGPDPSGTSGRLDQG